MSRKKLDDERDAMRAEGVPVAEVPQDPPADTDADETRTVTQPQSGLLVKDADGSEKVVPQDEVEGQEEKGPVDPMGAMASDQSVSTPIGSGLGARDQPAGAAEVVAAREAALTVSTRAVELLGNKGKDTSAITDAQEKLITAFNVLAIALIEAGA